MNHVVNATCRRLLCVGLLGLGGFAACGTVSEDPLAGTSGGNGGALSGGRGGSSGLATSSGSGGQGGSVKKEEPRGESGGAGEGATGGDEDGIPLVQAGAGQGGQSPGGSGGEGPGGAGAEGGAGGDDGEPRPPRVLRRCSSAAPFGTPERVPGMPDGAVRLRLDPSETIGYYARFPGTGTYFDLEVATRTSLVDAFSTGTPLNTNDSGWDFSPTLTGDGAVLYFERRDENLVWRIHQSVWDPEQQAFGPVDPVPGLGPTNGNHSDGGPYAVPSGDALYFHSNRSGLALYRAHRVGTSFAQVAKMPFTFPVGLALTTGSPVVSPDELTLYFAAHETGGPTDIWMTTRAKKGDAFGEAALLTKVSTADANEVPSFVSEDGCRLYFDRNSNVPFSWNPPAGNAFVAERQPDLE